MNKKELNMEDAREKLDRCYESIKDKVSFRPKVALVLGSGLGALADEIETVAVLDYGEIDGFPTSTVPGHKGRFVFGYIEGVPVVVMQGRVHYYEGYSMTDVVLPARLMRLMGAEILFLTNASGGLTPDFTAGTFMLITDHIMNFVPSPLIGANFDRLGPRFPDMSEIYNKKLRAVIGAAAEKESIPLKEGVYVQLTGPNFESPSEVKMCAMLGGGAVGMSTAVEAVAGNHAGMKVCGISCVANLGCGLSDKPLSHAEVMEAADNAAPMFKKLIRASIAGMKDIQF